MLPSGLDHAEIVRCVSSTLLEVVATFVINLAIHGHTFESWCMLRAVATASPSQYSLTAQKVNIASSQHPESDSMNMIRHTNDMVSISLLRV
jgi:hypothetical protein